MLPSVVVRNSPKRASVSRAINACVARDRYQQRRCADGGLQGRRGAFLDDLAVVDDGDSISELVGLLEVLRRQQDGGSFAVQTANLLPQRDAAHRIEPRCRLVEEQHSRLMDQAERQVETTAHAARIGADPAIGSASETNAFEQFGGAWLDLGDRQAVEHCLQVQQLVAGHQWIDGRILQSHADVAAHIVGLRDDIETGHLCRAGRRLQQSRQHPDDRAFSGAVRAKESEDLAVLHFEVDTVDRLHRTEVANETLGSDGRLLAVHRCLACTKCLYMSNCLHSRSR